MKKIVFLYILFFILCEVKSQTISFSTSVVNQNSPLELIITSLVPVKNYSSFPDIKGLKKAEISTSTESYFENGKEHVSFLVKQLYHPFVSGHLLIPEFKMEVNGVTINVASHEVDISTKVGVLNLENWTNRTKSRELVFIDFSIDKKSVFVGEGFHTVLALYVSEKNKSGLDFIDLTNQLADILTKLKPEHCLEEKFQIDEVLEKKIIIDGEKYTQYKLLESIYYPVHKGLIKFKPVVLKMSGIKQTKSKTFFENNYEAEIKEFVSLPVSIQVKELPPHPLKDKIGVGDYTSSELITTLQLHTGQSFNYQWTIKGEGNTNAIDFTPINNPSVELISNKTTNTINRSNNKIAALKMYNFYGVIYHPGVYDFSKLVQFIYFNYRLEKYDTLHSKIKLNVSGQAIQGSLKSSPANDAYFSSIPNSSNEFIDEKKNRFFKLLVNSILSIIICITFVFMVRKKKK